jgi:uncharacterized protein
VFLLIFLVLESTIFGYPAWRILSAAEWSASTTTAVTAAVVIAALLTPAYVVAIRAAPWPRAAREAFAWITYLLLAVAGILFGVFLLRDLVWSGLWLLDLIGLLSLPTLEALQIHHLNLATAGVGCLLTLYGTIGAHLVPRVRHVEVPIKDLPEALESMRIVQLSDLHVGPTIKRGFVSRLVDAVNALEPDVIVFTGDLADGSAQSLADDVAPLADLSCGYGPYFVTGNHEYYADPSGWMQALPGLGFELLLNEHRSIDWVSPEQSPEDASSPARLIIGGIPDPTGQEVEDKMPGHTPRPEAVFANAPEGVRLLLAHQPRAGVPAMAATGAALTLSGHTHGGQLGLWRLLVRLQQPVVAGLARRGEGWIYVSRGVGYWGPPCRLGAPSEITCLRLVRAPQA